MTFIYRPSGPMKWLLNKVQSTEKWSLIGSISPEERSLSVLSELLKSNSLENAELIRVEPDDRVINQYRKRYVQKLNQCEKKTKKLAGKKYDVVSMDLLCRENILVENSQNALNSCATNLIIDITSMPKRFFFPLISLAIKSKKHQNIVVTYSSPKQYGQVLAEDPLPWRPLPMFGAIPPKQDSGLKLLIGVGYQPLQLNEIFSGLRFNSENVELYLPFPSVHPGFSKNWEFILQIKKELGELKLDSIQRIPTTNVSLAFERLLSSTVNGSNPAVLAPFGPKPISLAMCLYGIAIQAAGKDVEIGYTQPQVYSDQYSIGIATIDSEPVINAYCIRLCGRNLFELN